MDELELRVAWEQHVAPDPAWFESLLAAHRQAHRRYHTVRHVCWVVRQAISLAGAVDVADLGAIVAAAFFHDAVYDPYRADNEQLSAGLARRALAELGWPADRVERVAAMIEATADHAAEGTSTDTAVLLAADLAVLAADPAGYTRYVTGVRAEYGHVSDADWRAGRAAVLRTFTERPAIYDPRLGLDGWERRARGNLAAELAALEQAGFSDA